MWSNLGMTMNTTKPLSILEWDRADDETRARVRRIRAVRASLQALRTARPLWRHKRAEGFAQSAQRALLTARRELLHLQTLKAIMPACDWQAALNR